MKKLVALVLVCVLSLCAVSSLCERKAMLGFVVDMIEEENAVIVEDFGGELWKLIDNDDCLHTDDFLSFIYDDKGTETKADDTIVITYYRCTHKPTDYSEHWIH